MVCDTPTDDESRADLKFFLNKKVIDDTHYVWWLVHNQPKDVGDIGFKFEVSLNSRVIEEDDEEEHKDHCLKSFEGSVLPCEATAETVMEKGLGMVLDMDYIQGILTHPQFQQEYQNRMGVYDKVYYFSVCLKRSQS